MRLSVLTAVFLLTSVASHSEEAVTALTGSCAQANSDLERHNLGCRDEDMYIITPESDAND